MSSLIENDQDNKDKNNKYLIITNAYPHEDQLYRNGFIHRRVKAYQAKRSRCRSFCITWSLSNF